MNTMNLEVALRDADAGRYDGAIDLEALRRAHRSLYLQRTQLWGDGNVAAAIPFLQWWRAAILAGFPITPSTRWLEYIAVEVQSGKFDVELGGRTVRGKRVKLLEAEHAVADYLVGVGAACRDLIVATATSSVGLDHMAETVRSLGASGLGNVMIVNVCRATANYPLCIDGDPSDLLANRDVGFVQVMCRGRQEIYDTILQMPAIGMHPKVLTPTMPAYYAIKDGHRSGKIVVEADEAVNAFLEDALVLGRSEARAAGARVPPGLLEGDTAVGNFVTSAWFQGFKIGQTERLHAALAIIPPVGRLFRSRFGRPGLEFFERHGMDDSPEVVLVTMGPDAGTVIQLLPALRDALKTRVGVLVVRVLSPFPSRELSEALRGVAAVGVVNKGYHHGRGHLTLDVADALQSESRALPVESFFCGLGGADVSPETWRLMGEITCEAAVRGRASRRWHLLHDGVELSAEP